MAANDYLKQASAMLRRAAEALKMEMNDLERQINTVQTERNMEIHALQRQEMQHQLEIAATDSSDEERRRMRQMMEARQAQSDTRKEIEQTKAQISQRIKQLQNDSQALLRQSSDLEQWASRM